VNTINPLIFVYYIRSQTATKNSKHAAMLNSPRTEKSYKLQYRAELETTLALALGLQIETLLGLTLYTAVSHLLQPFRWA